MVKPQILPKSIKSRGRGESTQLTISTTSASEQISRRSNKHHVAVVWKYVRYTSTEITPGTSRDLLEMNENRRNENPCWQKLILPRTPPAWQIKAKSGSNSILHPLIDLENMSEEKYKLVMEESKFLYQPWSAPLKNINFIFDGSWGCCISSTTTDNFKRIEAAESQPPTSYLPTQLHILSKWT